MLITTFTWCCACAHRNSLRGGGSGIQTGVYYPLKKLLFRATLFQNKIVVDEEFYVEPAYACVHTHAGFITGLNFPQI